MKNWTTAPSSCRRLCRCWTPMMSTRLAARILEQEHVAYSEAINIVLAGGYEIVGGGL